MNHLFVSVVEWNGNMKSNVNVTMKETPISKNVLDKNLTYDICSEVGCGTKVVVEKDFKSSGRKARCENCLVRLKFRYLPPID